MMDWRKPGLAAALLLTACGQGEARFEAPPPLVEAAPPVSHHFIDRIEAVGTARADEQVTLTSPVTDRIVKLNFSDGQYVRKGQIIALLAQGRQTAALAGALALEANAGQQLQRLRTLKERGFVTSASLDAQIAAAAESRAQAQAARADISDRVVRAPFSGFVSLRTISAGAVVNQGTPIATISDLSRIKLDFTVPETLLTTVRPGGVIEARVAAYPGRSFSGRISAVDPVIDPNTRAILVRASIPNLDSALKPGMLLNIVVQGASRMALAVPELAVVSEGDGRFVYVIDREGKAQRRVVEVGVRDDGLVEVKTGIARNDRVIGEGVVKVRPGLKVRTGPAGKAK